MDCPRCGDELLPNSRHCLNCGSELDDKILELAEAEKKRKNQARLSDSTDLFKLALFSVVYPGLGHIVYFRDFFHGALFAAGFTALLFAAHIFVGTFYFDMPLLFAAYLIYSLAPVHAFRLYRAKYNVAEDSGFRSAAFIIRYFVVIATAAIFLGAYSNYQRYFYYVVSVNSPVYEPHFFAGDRLLVSLNDERSRVIRRGDIVLFSVGRVVYRGAVTYSGGEYFEKVIGLPGETVRFGTDEISVDGTKLAAEYLPLSKIAMAEVEKREYILTAAEYLIVVNGSMGGRDVAFAHIVGRENIRGRISAVAWPPMRRGSLLKRQAK
ncbi:MAG: signal peptidase I [Candidatus Wallbacteria bacterium GWC2_49_35]|uniref:Signal peptidase I n=1 Tax=Candidatus Wallbacteria bacterium GWC2_49_35 TaxID=1817813 RepID=A0A1F7WVY2_9BACT|nr:MAG: signal peptidase I [Candidatus Wallbacteria bacterium GWC2_49_35]HBC76009.1 signal peptidase I [Candidatus Wallbacteria bacterium]